MKLSSLIFFMVLSGFSLTSMAAAKLKVLNGTSVTEKQHAAWVQRSESIQSVMNLINETFKLPQPLIFVFGSPGGPLYDPEFNQIEIPYTFITDIESLYKANQVSNSEDLDINEFKEDVVIHTLFHELGHALIALYDLPVIGREEDAADALAAIVAIDYFEHGQEIAISAAQMFQFEDLEREIEEQDFAGEHSLDIQRYYLTLCFVYGSSPKKYKYLVADGLLDSYRAESCLVDYQNTLSSWYKLLSPYLKEERQ